MWFLHLQDLVSTSDPFSSISEFREVNNRKNQQPFGWIVETWEYLVEDEVCLIFGVAICYCGWKGLPESWLAEFEFARPCDLSKLLVLILPSMTRDLLSDLRQRVWRRIYWMCTCSWFRQCSGIYLAHIQWVTTGKHIHMVMYIYICYQCIHIAYTYTNMTYHNFNDRSLKTVFPNIISMQQGCLLH